MLYVDIIYNLSLLVALSVLSSFIGQKQRWSSNTKSILQGIVFGGIAIIGMLSPLKLADGVIFDGRSVVISLCGLFFGPLAAIIAASMAVIVRAAIGGLGILTGSLVIASSAIFGVILRRHILSRGSDISNRHLLYLGLSVHAAMLLLMFTFPYDVAITVMKKVGLPIITIYPLATILIGRIIHDNLEKATYTAHLAISEEKYRRIAENMSDIIWTTDLAGKTTYISPSVERFLGKSVDQFLNETLAQQFSPSSLQFLMTVMGEELQFEKEASEDANRSRLMELEMYRSDGSLLWVSMNASFLRDKHGAAIGFQGVTRDISARKLSEIELLAAKEKAEESDRLKTAFLMNMSHEIRTPMNGILGFLSLLEEPDLEEESKKEYIEIMNMSSSRLLKTINDIIEISRIETGEMKLICEDIELEELLEHHVEFFTPLAINKQIEFRRGRTLSGTESLVYSDRHKLDGILGNLINNAIKFTTDGWIEVGNYIEDNAVVFYVQDSGCGIPSSRLDAIFERFVQGEVKLSRTHEGSGLGLPIVKAYVEALEGKIWVSSEEGKGSTFSFSLPIKERTAGEFTTPAESAAPEKLNKQLRVLIAEDDDTSYLYLQALLQKEGLTLLRTKNGTETVRVIREDPGIALVLMDIKMPVMNGLEATKQIRQFNLPIPIIAQSAFAASEDIKEAKEAGCTDYITKPISRSELFRLINKYSALMM
ncbi:MAG: ATP-binding protein [Bacteroidota bacterium]